MIWRIAQGLEVPPSETPSTSFKNILASGDKRDADSVGIGNC